MVKRESTVLLAALIGFCAFSLPLLIHDTRHLWSSPENAPMHTDSPPAPPTWHNYEDDAGQKFRHAVGDGDMPRVQEIYQESLAADPPVDLVTSEHWHGSTPLFEAARSGHLELAKWLVERGASADKSNEWGDTAANEAASMGHWDIVWFLADKGADLSRTTEHAHSTLVLSAVRHRSTDALAELQRRGVKLTQRSWNGGTALHEAARTGDGNVVDWCVSAHTFCTPTLPQPTPEPTPRHAQLSTCVRVDTPQVANEVDPRHQRDQRAAGGRRARGGVDGSHGCGVEADQRRRRTWRAR